MTSRDLTDKLPVEYPIKQALSIYLRRVFVFLAIVILNLGFLGVLLNPNLLSFFLWVLTITTVLFVPYAIFSMMPARMIILLGGQGMTPPRLSRREIILLIPFFVSLLFIFVLIIILGYGFLSLLLNLIFAKV